MISLSVLVACCVASSVPASSFREGGTAWTKHVETALLAEPNPLAPPRAMVGFALELTVTETKGAWLLVNAGSDSGWVFQGNVAAEKPSLPPATTWTTYDASRTDTVAAARPLAPAAEKYAAANNAVDAQGDVEWVDAQALQIGPDALVAYMSTHRKGEYQP